MVKFNTFVAAVENISGPVLLEQYVAIADYKKQNRNEVNMVAGDIVEVIDKNENGKFCFYNSNDRYLQYQECWSFLCRNSYFKLLLLILTLNCYITPKRFALKSLLKKSFHFSS